MIKKGEFELKVGVFVFAGLVVLSVIIFSISDIGFYKPKLHFKILFGYVNGVELGSPVRLGGVKIGEVQRMRVYRDNEKGRTLVELSVWVERKMKIEKDSDCFINTLGLFGEKYVEITAGKSPEFMQNGDVVMGRDPVSTEQFYQTAQKAVDQLSQLVSSVNEVMADKEVKDNLKQALKDSGPLAHDLKQFAASASVVAAKMEKGEGTVGKLLSDETIYNNLNAFVEDIKKHPWKLLHKGKEK